jgi:tetratricopeptide (TPR) repeat protein
VAAKGTDGGMTPDRWRKVQDLFAQAMELTPPSRKAYLAEACGDDTGLNEEIERLFEFHDRTDAVLDRGAKELTLVRRVLHLRALEPGRLLAEGRFRILRFVGEGGMGEVYEAEDLERAGQRVAIKTVKSSLAGDPDIMKRFRKEIELARRIDHPNVCSVYGFYAEPLPFCAMEFIDGETLSARLRRVQRIRPTEALNLIRQVASGLHAAHRAGIVHRDFKPGNVMLAAGDRAVITDFGLARIALPQVGEDSGLLSATATGQALGTPAYMAPEQIEGGKAGPQADVYALGVTIYEIVHGVNPFRSESPLRIAAEKIRGIELPKASLDADLEVPSNWRKVIQKCLAPKPEDRFKTALDVVSALEHGKRISLVPRHTWIRVGIAAALTFAALAFALWYFFYPAFHPDRRATDFYDRATKSLGAGSYERARGLLEEALQIDPNFPMARARLAQAFMELDQVDQARDQMLRMQMLLNGANISNRDRRTLAAIQKQILRDHEAAAKGFVELARDIQDSSSWTDAAVSLERAGQFQAAADAYTKAIGLASVPTPALQIRLAFVYGRLRNFTKANQFADAAMAQFHNNNDSSGQARALLAKAALSSEDGGQAGQQKQMLDQAILLAAKAGDSRTEIEAAFQHATLLDRQGKTVEASRIVEAALARAVQLQYEGLATQGLLGIANAMLARADFLGAEREARRGLALAVRTRSQLTEAGLRVTLAQALARQSKADESIREVERAIQFYRQGGFTQAVIEAKVVYLDAIAELKQNSLGLKLARQIFDETLASTQDYAQINRARQRIGHFLIVTGDYPAALATAPLNQETYRKSGNKLQEVLATGSRALIEIALGRLEVASQTIALAGSLVASIEQGPEHDRALGRVKYLHLAHAWASGRYSDAAQHPLPPNNSTAKGNETLFYALASRSLVAERQPEARQWLAANPRPKDFYSMLAASRAWLALGEFRKAADLAREARELGRGKDFALHVFYAGLFEESASRLGKLGPQRIAEAAEARESMFRELTATWNQEDRASLIRRPDIQMLWPNPEQETFIRTAAAAR